MLVRTLVAALIMVALAGCIQDDSNNPDGTLGTPAEVDCAELLEPFAKTTQEEYDALPEEEQLPEECADGFVAYIGPLTEVWSTGCSYVGIQNLVPEAMWGAPPEGFTFRLSNGQVAIVSLLLECDTLTYRNGTVDGTRLALHWIEVNAHNDWRDADVLHRYFFGGIANSGNEFDVYEEFGYAFLQQSSVTVQTQQNTDEAWAGQFSYNAGGFAFTGTVAAGADPSTSDEFRNRYYWHDADGNLGVMDSTINGAVQYLGAGDTVANPMIDAIPGTIPGVGFYGRGNGEPMELHAVRVDLLDPSA